MLRLVSGPWPLRVVWAVLPLVAGPALADAFADRSRPVQVAAAVVLWVGWAAALVALLVPRATSMTAARLAAPAPLIAAAVAAIAGPTGADDAVALAAGVAVAALVVSPSTTDSFVDGSSYGNERRFALRTPPALLLGPAPIAWLLAVAAPGGAVLALAEKAWVLGGALAVVAVPGVVLGVPAIHRLSQRWLVFVPAGVVVHDRLALADPVLLPRRMISAVRPIVRSGGGDGDLTLGARGPALSFDLVEYSAIGVARGLGRRREAVEVDVRSLLVAPLRPGAVLREAAARRLPVAR